MWEGGDEEVGKMVGEKGGFFVCKSKWRSPEMGSEKDLEKGGKGKWVWNGGHRSWGKQQEESEQRMNLINMQKMENCLTIVDVADVHWTFTVAISNVADVLKEKGS